MTIEEKNKEIELYCDGHGGCVDCPLYDAIPPESDCYRLDDDTITDSEIEYNYDIIFGEEKNDIINHPSHYCREGGMESIEEMVLVFGKEAVKHFCLCNVWKYRYRASSKNGEEDLHKSDWYMKKYKELCDDGTGEQIPLPF